MNASKNFGTVTAEEVLDGRHDPVIVNCKLKGGQGILAAGQVVKKDADGTVLAAVSGDTPFGVVLEGAEAADGKDTHAKVLVHGTCRREKVLVGSEAIGQSDVDRLMAAGVYAIY